MATLRFDPEAFARSNACIVIGVLLVAFTGYTFYLAIFDRPPLCDQLCILMALPPLLTSVLWSTWLLAWHLPHWQTSTRRHRWFVSGPMLASCAFTALFFIH